jgi:hypothetical protein
MTQSKSNEDSSKPGNVPQWSIHPAPMIDSMIDMQKQVLEYAVELNQAWTTRAQAESKLATDFASKLASARSIPDAVSLWQECLQRQMQLNAEDAMRLMDQNQRLMRVGTEIFSNSGGSVAT